MNILVLGGNGFIGSYVVDHLLAAGHSVRVFDRSSERYRSPLSNVDYRLGSFDDTFLLAEALQDMDAVCHLISTTVPGTSNLDPVEDVQSNLVNTLRLLEQMRTQGLHRILYLSSGGTVYGNPVVLPVREDHELNPICSYGVVKVAIEKYLFMYQQLYGLGPIVLRPSNLYGPRQGHAGLQGLIGTFLRRMIAGETLEVWGDGEIVRDYLYIEDLARLCVSAIEKGMTGVFNAGSGEGHSIKDIISTMEEVAGFETPVQYKKGRVFDVKEVILDIEQARQYFDWNPQTSLQEGMAAQLRWLKTL